MNFNLLKTEHLVISPHDKISLLKAIVQDRTAIPPEQQFLTYNSKILEDSQTLYYYNIRDWSTIRLNMRMRGGSIIRFEAFGLYFEILIVWLSDKIQDIRNKIRSSLGSLITDEQFDLEVRFENESTSTIISDLDYVDILQRMQKEKFQLKVNVQVCMWLGIYINIYIYMCVCVIYIFQLYQLTNSQTNYRIFVTVLMLNN